MRRKGRTGTSWRGRQSAPTANGMTATAATRGAQRSGRAEAVGGKAASGAGTEILVSMCTKEALRCAPGADRQVDDKMPSRCLKCRVQPRCWLEALGKGWGGWEDACGEGVAEDAVRLSSRPVLSPHGVMKQNQIGRLALPFPLAGQGIQDGETLGLCTVLPEIRLQELPAWEGMDGPLSGQDLPLPPEDG